MNEFIRPEGKWQLQTKNGYKTVEDLDAMHRIQHEHKIEEIEAEEWMMETMDMNRHQIKDIGCVRWVPGENEDDEI